METLKAKRGVEKFIILATHGELSGDAIEQLNDSPATTIVITDTIVQPEDKLEKIMAPKSKFKIVTVAPKFAEAIARMHEGQGSLSALGE